MEADKKSKELKHLGFVRMVAINAMVCVSNLYEKAKQNSGPLKSTVCTVEGAVTSAVGPVYEKFKGVPDDLLFFLDAKVDEATIKFDKHAPPLAKRVACQAHCMILKASEIAKNLVNEAQVGGPKAAVHYATAESKQIIVTQSVKGWYELNKIKPLHSAAQKAVPVAAQWSEKYNCLVTEKTKKGSPVFKYFPLVPVDDIAKTFKQSEVAKEKKSEAPTSAPERASSSSSSSDSE